MPIKFKVIEKGRPGVSGGGEKKYYASPVMDGELSLGDLTTAIEKICTVKWGRYPCRVVCHGRCCDR
jgi:hypothetical protein